jgi:DNA helicase IV
VVDLARAVLAAAGHDPDGVPQAVRRTGEAPVLHRVDDIVGVAAREAVARVRAREGTVAVIAPPADLEAVEDALDAMAEAAELDRIRVLDPRTAKGLEFDDVIVAAPEAIATASAVGTHQLYVAVTRATRTLTLVASRDGEVPGASTCVAGDPIGRSRCVGGRRG